jgi:hypothetical protein
MNSDSFLEIPWNIVSGLVTWDSSHNFFWVHLARVGTLPATGGVEPDVSDIFHTNKIIMIR